MGRAAYLSGAHTLVSIPLTKCGFPPGMLDTCLGKDPHPGMAKRGVKNGCSTLAESFQKIGGPAGDHEKPPGIFCGLEDRVETLQVARPEIGHHQALCLPDNFADAPGHVFLGETVRGYIVGEVSPGPLDDEDKGVELGRLLHELVACASLGPVPPDITGINHPACRGIDAEGPGPRNGVVHRPETEKEVSNPAVPLKKKGEGVGTERAFFADAFPELLYPLRRDAVGEDVVGPLLGRNFIGLFGSEPALIRYFPGFGIDGFGEKVGLPAVLDGLGDQSAFEAGVDGDVRTKER